jgi:hypothetical protein
VWSSGQRSHGERSRGGAGRRRRWLLAAVREEEEGQLGRKLKEICFRIKNEFLNIPKLWKFVGGDLGGILM